MSQSSSTGNFDVASLVEGVNFRRVAQYVPVMFLLGLSPAPLETGTMTAIKMDESAACSLPFTPSVGEGFALRNIQSVLEQFSGPFFNSLIMSIPATIGSILSGSMAAYGPMTVSWWTQMGMLMPFVVGTFVPYQAVLVPLTRFRNNVFPFARTIRPMVVPIPFFQGYHAKLVPLVITHIACGTPICMILFRSYYRSLPNSLVEVGKIDGANITKIYRRIVLSTSKPMSGAVFICQFTQIYNEFLFAFMLVTGLDMPAAPVTLVLPAIETSTPGINFGIRMSAAFLAVAPTFILYVVFAEQFAKGLRTEA